MYKKPLPPIKKPCPEKCPQLPGTILRINIPAGAVINLLNIIEVTSPSGICLIIRLPHFCKKDDRDGKNRIDFHKLANALYEAGGSIEYLE